MPFFGSLCFLRGGIHVWQAIPKKVVYFVMEITSYDT